MDKKKASLLLSRILKRPVRVLAISPVGSGYHSKGYKIKTPGKDYFIKQVISHDLGFEFPERKLSALVLSESMNKRARAFPRSLGVLAKNKRAELLPAMTDATAFYHVQEYGGDGTSYLQILNDRRLRTRMDQEDVHELDQIISFIARIHRIKHSVKDRKQLDAIYNDYLRNVIGHQEYAIQLLHAFPADAPILSPRKQAAYLGLLLEQMHHWKGRSDRLRALHGDFWAANAIKAGERIYFVDYSRMPWGDPAMDVGFWIALYVFMWHKTGNRYYRELADTFLKLYVQKTHDKEILKAISYPLGLVAIMYAHPTWVPGIAPRVRRSFFDHIVLMLKRKEFFWPQ